MNDKSNSSSANSDAEHERIAEDQLIDWGLRMNASSTNAPDFTDRILAAAALDPGEQVGDFEIVTEEPLSANDADRRVGWIAFAAVLLLGLTGLFGVRHFGFTRASELASRRVNFNTNTSSSIRDEGVAVAPTESHSADDEPMMMVTPRIVIEESEEDVFLDVRVANDEPGPATSRPSQYHQNNAKIHDLEDRFAAKQARTEELDMFGMEGGYGGYGEGGYGEGGGYGDDDGGYGDDDGGYGDDDGGYGGDGYSLSSGTVPSNRVARRKRKSRSRSTDRQGDGYAGETDSDGFEPGGGRHVEFFCRPPVKLKLVDSNGRAIALSARQQERLSLIVGQQLPKADGIEQDGDRYDRIFENPFVVAKGADAVSTFSIDVDTASYTNVRKYLQEGQLPPPDAVRLEEFVNYFEYDYAAPGKDAEHPFATHTEVADCPWNKSHRLVRVALKGREIDSGKRPLSNIVFLVDVSGSMNDPAKLPLVVDGLTHMTRELGENDQVAIVVYAGSEGLALPSTRGDKRDEILTQLQRLSAGGSTAGGAGINLAYKIAEENFIEGGANRVILCTDGDFNVGVSNTADLERLAETKAAETGVFLTVLGFGRGNLNDAMMEKISNCGNGTYHYIDSLREARRVLVQQLSGTLVTIAKDVKIQIEFNPANAAAYRLLGYENRMLARKDFNDDTKDAGEVGAGHTVTALYEVVPTGGDPAPVVAKEDRLKYQSQETEISAELADEETILAKNAAEFSDELLTLRLRYKLPDEDTSTKIEIAVKDRPCGFGQATSDFRFAASVAGFGMLLRDSQHKGTATLASIRGYAAESLGDDVRGFRTEFIGLIDAAAKLRQ